MKKKTTREKWVATLEHEPVDRVAMMVPHNDKIIFYWWS